MSNEISAAKGIGSRIAGGTGSIPTLKFKKPSKEKTTQTTASAGQTTSKPKQEKAAKGRKPKKEAKQGPIKVESTVVASRPNRPSPSPAGEITSGQPQLPGGPRWEEFKSYVEANKAGKMSPPVNLD